MKNDEKPLALQQLKSLRDSPIAEVKRLYLIARATSEEASWYALAAVDGREDPGYCCKLFRDLVLQKGKDAVQQFVCGQWSNLSEGQRRNICYCVFDPQSISTEFAEQLFYLDGSNTHERHLICAGLASSMSRRSDVKPTLKRLIEKIGAYENPQRQNRLDRFISNVKNNL